MWRAQRKNVVLEGPPRAKSTLLSTIYNSLQLLHSFFFLAPSNGTRLTGGSDLFFFYSVHYCDFVTSLYKTTWHKSLSLLLPHHHPIFQQPYTKEVYICGYKNLLYIHYLRVIVVYDVGQGR